MVNTSNMFSLPMLLGYASVLYGRTSWDYFNQISHTNSDFYFQEICNNNCISNRIKGSTIEEIPDVDIGSIDPDSYVDDEEAEIIKPIIAAVLKLEHFRACMRCKSRVESIASKVGAQMMIASLFSVMICVLS